MHEQKSPASPASVDGLMELVEEYGLARAQTALSNAKAWPNGEPVLMAGPRFKAIREYATSLAASPVPPGLHAAIMNLRADETAMAELSPISVLVYKTGHRDARHAAAELVSAHPVSPASPVAYCNLEMWKSGKHWPDDCFTDQPGEGRVPIYSHPPVSPTVDAQARSRTKQGEHTPGPWSLTKELNASGVCYLIGSASMRKARAAAEICNFHLTPQCLPEPEAAANAQLMTAAPDMLEALKFARRSFPVSGSADAYERICAAIQKATGAAA